MSTQNHIVPDLEDILENYPGWLDEAIDTPAVAQLTGVPACTLNTWRCRGGGPSFLKLGKCVRYRRRTVLNWMVDCETHREVQKGGTHV
jgi:predicted DNA-binding transcriptional regulator AlpA